MTLTEDPTSPRPPDARDISGSIAMIPRRADEVIGGLDLEVLSRMRDGSVGILVSQLSPGGAEHQTVLLAEHLAAQYGVRPWIYVMAEPTDVLAARIRASGCELVWKARKSNYEVGRCVEIRRHVMRRRTAILHAIHYEASAYGFLATLGLANVVVVPSIRSSAQTPNLLKDVIYRHMFRAAPIVIANSHSGADFLGSRFGVPKSRLRVIQNGIDPIRCKPTATAAQVRRRLDIPVDATVIAYVGKNSPVKDIPLLLRIVASVLTREPRSRFLLIGEGLDSGLLMNLPFDLRSRVYGLGGQQDPITLLAASDLLVLTSRSEGCPNVLLEAMVVGVPPVASAVGDCPRVIRDGVDGFLFRPGDDSEATSKLLHLIHDVGLRQQMSKHARERILNSFHIDNTVAETVATYQQLLADSQTRTGRPR